MSTRADDTMVGAMSVAAAGASVAADGDGVTGGLTDTTAFGLKATVVDSDTPGVIAADSAASDNVPPAGVDCDRVGRMALAGNGIPRLEPAAPAAGRAGCPVAARPTLAPEGSPVLPGFDTPVRCPRTAAPLDDDVDVDVDVDGDGDGDDVDAEAEESAEPSTGPLSA
ncbi:MAG: hypothetical protein WCP30_06095 [Mycobacteriaceae bacterium]